MSLLPKLGLQGFSVALFAIVICSAPICRAQESQHTVGGDSSARSPRALGEKRKVKGVPNFGKVTPRLFRGAEPSEQGLEALARMGVDIVVDARGSLDTKEEKAVKDLGMKYVSIPWHCSSPHDEVFARFLKLLKDNPDREVFVHCHLGVDRTGMMIASYRMAVDGWSADDAMLEMQHFGFSPEHHFICPHLAPYEQSFPKRLKNNSAFEDLR